MELIIVEDYDALSKEGYRIVEAVLKAKQDACLGLATGSTPLGLYKEMIAGYKKGLSYKKVTSYNLDEYAGLGEGDSQSYRTFMNENLFSHIDIDISNTHVPDGKNANLESACRSYNDMLAKNVRDIQILGIGVNGHIAFNEPGTDFESVTHVVELSEDTVLQNARFFDSASEVPKRAISMGIANIMEAKAVVLFASGPNKAQAVYDTVKGEISPRCPASVIRTHAHSYLIADKAAAALLQ